MLILPIVTQDHRIYFSLLHYMSVTTSYSSEKLDSQYRQCIYLFALLTYVSLISQLGSSHTLVSQPHGPHQSQILAPNQREGKVVQISSSALELTSSVTSWGS